MTRSVANGRVPLPPRLEEILQQRCRFTICDTAIDLGPVMTGRLAEDTRSVLDAAALGIRCAVVEAAQASEGDRLGAHRAGFERDVEVAFD